MALWRERLFAAMARNAGSVTDYFNIPTNRVVELGTRVEMLARELLADGSVAYSGTVCGFVGSEICMTRYFTVWVALPLRETACSAPGGS